MKSPAFLKRLSMVTGGHRDRMAHRASVKEAVMSPPPNLVTAVLRRIG